MAIAVNTSRTVKPGMSDADRANYTLGIWPYQRSQTISDIEEYADVIFGVTSGTITFGAEVDRVVVASADPNRWEVIAKANPAPWVTAMIGRKITPEFAWKPGQGWPVKLIDTATFRGAHEQGDPEVSLGAYRLVMGDGGAHLYVPRGGDVHIHVAG